MFHTKSPQAKALVYTVLFSALCHLTITLFVTILTNTPDAANMFNVLGVSMIFPELGKGAGNSLLGAVAVIAIWFAMFGVIRLQIKKKD